MWSQSRSTSSVWWLIASFSALSWDSFLQSLLVSCCKVTMRSWNANAAHLFCSRYWFLECEVWGILSQRRLLLVVGRSWATAWGWLRRSKSWATSFCWCTWAWTLVRLLTTVSNSQVALTDLRSSLSLLLVERILLLQCSWQERISYEQPQGQSWSMRE